MGFMAATVSQTDQRRLRRQQAASLWLRGVPQTQIATQLGVSSQTIARDLRVIRQEWVQTRVTDWEMAREIELRKLDALEREAWEAWDRSQRHAETNKVSGSGADLGEKRRGEKISHSRTGDAKYLDVVARCIDRRCALLGINSLPGTNAPIVVQTAEIRQALLMDDNFIEYCRHRACHGYTGHVGLLSASSPLGDVSAPGPAGPGADGPVAGALPPPDRGDAPATRQEHVGLAVFSGLVPGDISPAACDPDQCHQ